MKNKKLLYGLGITLVTPLSVLPVISCKYTVANTVQTIIGMQDQNLGVSSLADNMSAEEVYNEVTKDGGLNEEILWKYVTKPTLQGGVYFNVKEVKRPNPNIVSDDEENGFLDIVLTFKKGDYKQDKELRTVKGFLSRAGAERRAVNQEIEDVFSKINANGGIKANNEGEKKLPDSSDVKTNLSTYVINYPTPTNKDTFLETEIIKTNNEKGLLNVSFKFRKEKAGKTYYSNKKDIIINGFKTQEKQDKEEVDKLYDKHRNDPLSVNDEGRKQIVSKINKENIQNFVDGWAKIDSNVNKNTSLKIKSVGPKIGVGIDQIVVVQYYFEKVTEIDLTRETRTTKSETIEREVGNFRSIKEQNQIDVDEAYKTHKDEELTINNQGKEVTAVQASSTNNAIENIHSLISNWTEIGEGIRRKVHSVEAKENVDGIITIKYKFSKGDELSQEIIKDVSGFLPLANYEYNNWINSPLTINEKGRLKLANVVNKTNLAEYVDNLPTPNNGVKLDILSVTPDDANKKIVVKYKFSKFNIDSQEITKEVNGFLSIEQQNQIDVDNEYQKYLNISLEATDSAKTILSTDVNKTNIRNYISNLPQPSNGVSLNITEVLVKANNEKLVVVRYNFTKESVVSREITKEVNGFLTIGEQSKIDVDLEFEKVKDTPLTITEEGKKVVAETVNKENVRTYIQGWPTLSSNIEIEIDDVDSNSQAQRVIVRYRLIKRYRTSQNLDRDLIAKSEVIKKEVTGFLTVDQQDRTDVDNYAAQSMERMEVNVKGSETKVSAINKTNLNEYVNNIPQSQNGIRVEIYDVRAKENVPNKNILIVSMRFTKGTYSKIEEKEIVGFKAIDNKEVFIEEVEKITANLRPSVEGRKRTAYWVNNNTFKQYIDGLPGEDSGYNLEFINKTTSDDETVLNITIRVIKNGFSHEVEREIHGFNSKISEAAIIFSTYISDFSQITIKKSISNILSRDMYEGGENKVREYFNVPERVRDIVTVSLEIKYSYIDSSLNNSQIKFIWNIKNTTTNKGQSVTNVFSGFKDPFSEFNSWNNKIKDHYPWGDRGWLEATWQTTWGIEGVSWGWHQIGSDLRDGNSEGKKHILKWVEDWLLGPEKPFIEINIPRIYEKDISYKTWWKWDSPELGKTITFQYYITISGTFRGYARRYMTVDFRAILKNNWWG